ncbi:MAG: hypothetical protein GY756_08460 [bacterium]|nr:hypothetical protein [bacterium]
MKIRKYDPKIDKDSLQRVVKEVGWGDFQKPMEIYVSEGRNFVAEVDGQVEAFCSTSLGNIQYLDQQLSYSEIGTVATSLLVRQQFPVYYQNINFCILVHQIS